MSDEARAAVRGATYRGDGEEVLAALRRVDVELALQLGGGGALAALSQGVSGASEMAECFVAALGERCWDGDAELAAELRAALGMAAEVALVEIAVDLAELSSVLEDDRLDGGAINLHNGEVWPTPALDYLAETGDEKPDLEDHDEWLIVGYRSSRSGYFDMEAFIDTVDDSAMVDRLSAAIRGKGAFGRFRLVLQDRDDLLDRWYAFSEERGLGRARAWLADAGYRPQVHRRLRLVD